MGVVLGLVLILSLAWYTVVQGRTSWILLQTYLGVSKRRPTDVSHLSPTPPPQAKKTIATLETLGFHRLGEAEVPLPHVRTGPYWILVNSDNSIQAEAVHGRVAFSTFFDDKVLVVTDYPNGEHLQTPTYESRTITTSIKDALDYHKLQVDKFRARYGSPQSISDMVDYVRWEVIGRVNYGRLKLRRLLLVSIARLIMFTYGAAICVVSALVWASNLESMLADSIQREMGSLFILRAGGLTFLLGLVFELLFWWVSKGSRRDSRRIAQGPMQAKGRGHP